MKAQTRTGIQAPRLSKHLPAGSINPSDEHADYTGVALAAGSFENRSFESASFELVRCRHVVFIRAKLPKLHLLDVRLDVCDLSAADLEEGHIRRAEFAGCRMWGTDLYKAQFQDVLFHECNAEHAVFTQATFKAARFEKCNLGGVSFAEADLSGVAFHRCDLSQADLRGATLKGADLRTSILEGMQVNAQDLRGAIIEPAQAVQIATILGIEIRTVEAPANGCD
jgi:uncharacterized protein YjbI with pentapeptide repeats